MGILSLLAFVGRLFLRICPKILAKFFGHIVKFD